VGGIDGDATRFFFRRVVNLVKRAYRTAPGFRADFGQRGGQRGFAVVNVTNGADVDVRFVTFTPNEKLDHAADAAFTQHKCSKPHPLY